MCLCAALDGHLLLLGTDQTVEVWALRNGRRAPCTVLTCTAEQLSKGLQRFGSAKAPAFCFVCEKDMPEDKQENAAESGSSC